MRLRFNRIGIIFALFITVGATSVSASNAHHCLIGDPITTWKTTDNWSKNYEEFALTSPANTNWDEFCIYMWVETNQKFAFNNHFFNPNPEDAKQVGPSSDQATINKDGGTGVGVATDGTTNAWKYTGATGLVKICAAQSSGGSGQGEWKPYVWVEESKEIEILKGNKIMFYFGSSTGKGEHNWLYLSATSTTSHSASEQYHRLNETKCTSYISVAYVDAGIRYYISDYSSWAGVQMESTAEAGCLYSVYNDGSDKIYKNVADGAIPYFATTTVNKTVGTVDSEIAATVTNSIYGNEQVLYYYYTTDGGTTFTKFDPSDISTLAVGVYTVYALGWDGHILVRSDNTVTLNVGVTISLDANGGTDGDVTSVFATSGIAASTGNIAAASLPTKTGYIFNCFWTSEGIEVINENGEWKTDVSGYTDNSGNWICSAASTLYAHWTPKPYIVTLEGMEADPKDPILVNVTYDAVLPSLETKHTKAHYDLLGYWAANDDHGMNKMEQLIYANGDWISDVAGYTGKDGAGQPTWVHDFNISLFAKWEEHSYTVTTSVWPAGAGTLSCGASVTAKWVTPSELITATANPAWKFVRWEYGENVGPADGTGLDNTVQINATVDGTLRAVFEPRYALLGQLNDDSGEAGGMPGMDDYTVDFEVKSYNGLGDAGVDLQCTRILQPNAFYGFYIHDRVAGKNYGKNSGDNPTLGSDEKWMLNDQDWVVLFNTSAVGPYTFMITNITEDNGAYYPTVEIVYPTAHQLELGWRYTLIDTPDELKVGDTGGTVTATSSGFSIKDKEYIADGEELQLMANANTGYTFDDMWYDNNDCQNSLFMSGNPTHATVTSHFRVYAKFAEIPTLITITKIGGGEVQINGEDKESTSVGVTTTRTLTAVAAAGYIFSGWTLPDNADFEMIAGDVKNPTITLRGKGAGTEGEITANFTACEYTVTLEDMEPTTAGQGSVSVMFDASDNMTSAVTQPTKTHYDFRGYWIDNNVQLIDEKGNWKKDVSPYTGSDADGNPTWIYPNDISLFAKWEEHSYTVTTSVWPAGAGTLSCGASVTAKWVTPSELITATANPAWKFVRWEYGENVGPADGTGLNNTVQIKAAVDGTLTAVFEPRFCLVGAKWDNSGNGGMPGWHDYTADFIVNSYTDLSTMNLTCVRSLDPNTTYKFEVHDKVKGQNFGYSGGGTYIADQSLLFNKQNNDVFLRVNGHGECTFTISALSSGDLYPTVSVAIPASHQLNLEWADVDIDNNWNKTSRATGGSVSAQTPVSGHNFAIHNGEYVAHGGDITYTATPATGYTFEGWYNNDYNTRFSITNPYTSSNIQTTENVEAKFVEKATAVTLSNDGHGHVEINDETVSSTTVGITTHRELTAVPDEGYKFDSWTKISGDDITLSSTSENPTTLSGLGSGAVSGQEVRANFVERWIVQPEVGEWGYAYFTIEHIEEVGGKTIGYVDITLEANTNYQFSVVDRDGDVKYKNGSNQVYFMTNGNSHNWEFATDKSNYCGITTAGAGVYRFTWNITDKKMTVTYPNFIIYRTGDKADDPRAQSTDVESYEGGTIEKAIEYRMKVQTIDQWYSLTLPFAVSAVKVWDAEDGAYYDIVPFYRSGGKFYTGHYVIRKPEMVTNYAIKTFEEKWVDPDNSGVLPEKNTPYIIQWHEKYFQGKYISFFGDAGQIIPADFNVGEAPSADDVVNVFGNNTMHSGIVRGAYLLDKDYGPSGAWLREDIGTNRTILPFECFIRANDATTTRYRILRRGMEETDTPTALEQISNHQSPMTIRVYTITGVLVGEYNDCSFQDAAHRIATDHNEGIYILRSENESMKLLLGGK